MAFTHGYFGRKCEQEREKGRLEIEMPAAHQCIRETYRVKRLHSDLTDRGVRTLREKLVLRCKQMQKFKMTTDSRESLPVAPTVLNR
ncbi:hypothetical protein [Nitrosomonas aestuarii]|uniref:hypothetical protein n=1 Tax=Nitrosomonas aestuarii TaxID=52441 RepID=UPI0011B257B7|nr:hypothetical protein [Nitrosomonas aestuarii]